MSSVMLDPHAPSPHVGQYEPCPKSSSVFGPIILQSDPTVEKGPVRLKTRSGFLFTVKKYFFQPNIFRLSNRTRTSSRKTSSIRPDVGFLCSRNRAFSTQDSLAEQSFQARTCQSKKSRRFDWMCESDCSVNNVLEAIASSSHYKLLQTPTRPHVVHTPMPRTTQQYHTTNSMQQRRRWLGCYHRRGFSPQVSVAHS